jgi:hypothetical protein
MAGDSGMYFDSEDPDIIAKLKALPPTPGYCFFIDICGSTALKDSPIENWARIIANVFNNIRSYLATLAPLKGIGDELMYYLPEAELAARDLTVLGLFSCLTQILRTREEGVYGPVKASLLFCSHAYELSFMRGRVDFYGKDVDLTARMISEAGPGDLIMNEPFVHRLREEYLGINQEQFPDVERLVGPLQFQPHGFNASVGYYKLPGNDSPP